MPTALAAVRTKMLSFMVTFFTKALHSFAALSMAVGRKQKPCVRRLFKIRLLCPFKKHKKKKRHLFLPVATAHSCSDGGCRINSLARTGQMQPACRFAYHLVSEMEMRRLINRQEKALILLHFPPPSSRCVI